MDVVGGCDVGDAVFFQPLDNRPARFRNDSLMPEFFAKRIPEIMAVVHLRVYIANGRPLAF